MPLTDTRVTPSDDPVSDTEAPAPREGDRTPKRRDVAVALGHDSGSSDLPRVVATGKGEVARQILEIAFARGIKVREDADLAEVLAAIEVDSEIPLAAFAAVAEILSYVYRAQGKGPDGSAANEDSVTGGGS
ncbi:MAG TPA: EscU/YscU/HrcU family type III secretion system export apparatus switch protein [Sphingomonadaceae bacterium]|nr:EscU/YscU/HrcU family type III secretion system export apparatus switch protein [Sphingomonadaceae bacterium]